MAAISFDTYAARARAKFGNDVSDDQIADAYEKIYRADAVRTEGPDFDTYASRAKARFGDQVTDDQISEAYGKTYGTGFFNEQSRAAARGLSTAPVLMGMAANQLGKIPGLEGFRDLGYGLGLGAEQLRSENKPSTQEENRAWYNPKKIASDATEMGTGMIPMIGAGLITGGLGAPLALTTAVGAGIAGVTEAEGFYRQLLDEGVPEEEAFRKALIYFPFNAALNALPFKRLIGRDPRRLLSGAIEAGTEIAEEPIQALIAGKDPIQATIEGAKAVGPAAFLFGAATGRTAPNADANRKRFEDNLGRDGQPLPEGDTGLWRDGNLAQRGLGQLALPAPPDFVVGAEGVARRQGEIVPNQLALPPPAPSDVLQVGPDGQASPTTQAQQAALDQQRQALEALGSGEAEAIQQRQAAMQAQQAAQPLPALPPPAPSGVPSLDSQGQALEALGSGEAEAIQQRQAAMQAQQVVQFLPALPALPPPAPSGVPSLDSQGQARPTTQTDEDQRQLERQAMANLGITQFQTDASPTWQTLTASLQGIINPVVRNQAYMNAYRNPAVRQQLFPRERQWLDDAILQTEREMAKYTATTNTYANEQSDQPTSRETTTFQADQAPVTVENDQGEPLSPRLPIEQIRQRVATEPALREALTDLVSRAGWAQRGGKMLTKGDPSTTIGGAPDVTGRTGWLPSETWWSDRVPGMTPAKAEAAVKAALAGRKLGTQQEEALRFLVETADERGLKDKGPAPELTIDELVEKAEFFDEAAVMDLARTKGDEAAFREGLQQIIDRGAREAFGRRSAPSPQRATAETQIRATINRLVRSLSGLAPKIVTVQSFSDLPAHIQAVMPTDVEGVADLPSNSVYLVVDNLQDQYAAERVIAHEVVGHIGMARLLGSNWNKLLADVQRLKTVDPIIRKIAAEVELLYADVSQKEQNAEIIAFLAETSPKHPLTQKILVWLRDALRRLGFRLNLSRADLIGLLSEANQLMRTGSPSPTGLQQIASLAREQFYGSRSRPTPVRAIPRVLARGPENFTAAEKKGFDAELRSRPDGKGIRASITQNKGTGYARQAVEAVLIRHQIKELIAGRDVGYQTSLDGNRVIKAMIASTGMDGVWSALARNGMMGGATKPEHSIPGSFADCRPSHNCATYCYATKGNYKYDSGILKGELMAFAVEADPARAAQQMAAEYKATPEFRNNKALRIHDKGDLGPGSVEFIQAMNAQGVRIHSFSKRPELLRQLPAMNLRLLSGDYSNLEMLRANPDLPVAFVYRGKEDLPAVRELLEAGRLQLVLPIQGDFSAVLLEEEVKALRKGAPGVARYVCPIDAGIKTVATRQNRAYLSIPNAELTTSQKAIIGDSWNCTKCDSGGGIGCYNGQVTKQVMLSQDVKPSAELVTEALRALQEKINEYVADASRLSGAEPAVAEARSVLAGRVQGLRDQMDALLAELLSGDGRQGARDLPGGYGDADAGEGGGGPRSVGDGGGLLASRRRPSPGQIEMVYDQAPVRPGTTDKQKAEGKAALKALFYRDRRAGASMLGNALYENAAMGKGTDLVGATINNANDLAYASQILRDPRFETLRYYAMRGGKIVGHFGISSRMPGYVSFAIPRHSDTQGTQYERQMRADQIRFKELLAFLKSHKAEGIWVSHNHPSGRSQPSAGDVGHTQWLEYLVGSRGYKMFGHVVIDNGEYSTVASDGKKETFASPLHKLTSSIPNDLLGTIIDSPQSLAITATNFQVRDGWTTLISISNANKLQAIAELPTELLTDSGGRLGRLRAVARLRNFWRKTAGGLADGNNFVFAVTKNRDDVHHLYISGQLVDVVDEAGVTTSSQVSMSRKNIQFEYKNRSQRVDEPRGKYDAGDQFLIDEGWTPKGVAALKRLGEAENAVEGAAYRGTPAQKAAAQANLDKVSAETDADIADSNRRVGEKLKRRREMNAILDQVRGEQQVDMALPPGQTGQTIEQQAQATEAKGFNLEKPEGQAGPPPKQGNLFGSRRRKASSPHVVLATFPSGMTRPEHIAAAAKAGSPIGVDIREASGNVMGYLARALQGGLPVFVDSGAFGLFRKNPELAIDGPATVAKYQALLNSYNGDPSLLTVVAPDKVGDGVATLQMLEASLPGLNELMAQGARVVVPVQDTASVPALVNLFQDSPETPVWGIPSKAAAMTDAAFRTFLRLVRPDKLHILGAASEATARKRLDVIADELGDAEVNITMDANLLRSSLRKMEGQNQGQRIDTFAKILGQTNERRSAVTFEDFDREPGAPDQAGLFGSRARTAGGMGPGAQAGLDIGTAPPPPAGTLRPDSIEVGGGQYSTASMAGLSDQQLFTLRSVMDQFDSPIEAQRRGTRTWDVTEEAALAKVEGELGITLRSLVARKAGATANAETLLAYGQIIATASREVHALSQRVRLTQSNEDILALVGARERLGQLVAPALGYATEAGRSLNILRKQAALMRTADHLLTDMGDGSRAAMLDYAKRIGGASSLDQVVGVTAASYKATWWDKFFEYWINGLLSGPTTHAVNITSNAMFRAIEEAALTAGAVTGRDYTLRNVAARQAAMPHGVMVGLKNMGQAFLTEEPQLNPTQKIESEKYRAIPGVLGKIIRVPGRLLMAEDEFFKGIAYHAELADLVMTEALRASPTDPMPEFHRRMGDVLNRPDLIKKAMDAADEGTFTKPLGPVGIALTHAVNKSKVGRLIVPFIRTPTNIMKIAVKYTPGALAVPSVREALAAGGKDAALARGRMIVGSGIMLGAVALVAEGLMSGSGPPDPRERAQLMQTGWRPYSVLIDGQWVKYNRFDPMGTIMGVAADLYDLSGYMTAGEIDKVPAMIMTAIALNLGDKTFLRGVTDFAQAYTDPKRYLADWSQQMVGTAVPTLVAQVARASDPFQRESNNILDAVRERIPGMREELAKRIDISGQPIQSDSAGFGIPLNISAAKEAPLATAMLELGVRKEKPSRVLQGIELGDKEYEALSIFMGQARTNVLTPMVSSPQFQQLKAQNPVAANAMLDRAWEKVSQAARIGWLYRNPQVLRKVMTNKRLPKTIEPSEYLQ